MAVIQAKAHVDAVSRASQFHAADIAVARFTVLAGGDVRAMIKIDEIRQVHELGPAKRLLFLPERHELIDGILARGSADLNVLVAAYAALFGGDGSHWAVKRLRVAEEAFDACGNVFLVRKVDGAAVGSVSAYQRCHGQNGQGQEEQR